MAQQAGEALPPWAIEATPPETPSASQTAEATSVAEPMGLIYTVQAGDTLSTIATRFDTTVAAIVTANGLANPETILIGQELVIPVLAQP